MKRNRTFAVILAASVCLAALAAAQDKPKSAWMSGKIAALDLANNRIDVQIKDSVVKVLLDDPALGYEKWAPAKIEDFIEGKMVGVWGKFEEGQDKLTAKGWVLMYPQEAKASQILDYKITGAFTKKDGMPAIMVNDRPVTIEIDAQARVTMLTAGSKEDLQVGYDFQFPTTDEGDTLHPQKYVRYMPPKE